jgi:hypothetical protein
VAAGGTRADPKADALARALAAQCRKFRVRADDSVRNALFVASRDARAITGRGIPRRPGRPFADVP